MGELLGGKSTFYSNPPHSLYLTPEEQTHNPRISYFCVKQLRFQAVIKSAATARSCVDCNNFAVSRSQQGNHILLEEKSPDRFSANVQSFHILRLPSIAAVHCATREASGLMCTSTHLPPPRQFITGVCEKDAFAKCVPPAQHLVPVARPCCHASPAAGHSTRPINAVDFQ